MWRRRSSVEEILKVCEDGQAERALRDALDLVEREPGNAALASATAEAALRTGDPDLAVVHLRRAVTLSAQLPRYAFELGQALQFTGATAESETWFARAAASPSAGYRLPHRVTAELFDAAASAVVAALPREFAEALDSRGTTITSRQLPALERVRDEALDPHALGYYFSNPLGINHYGDQTVPDAIEIYQLAIENWSGDRAELHDQIRITVLHEIGHAFGMDHDSLDADGY